MDPVPVDGGADAASGHGREILGGGNRQSASAGGAQHRRGDGVFAVTFGAGGQP